ncbi:unnamed protein product [Caenorhabditis auriculariae]|uniref:Lipid-binding serum glycoprotein C-terminal domain-containing protein n=1 Tax=Caenorhabditis auriculariae TaxID=2777116 RepID=A0A8S1GYJ9_9PELO|nr:unnamed protein product [Caenorhabditis auriculariae]
MWEFLLIVTATANVVFGQIEDVNAQLFNDRQFEGAGVKSRLTTTGTNYVAGVVANALVVHFADVRLPPKTFQLQNAPTVTVSNTSLTSFRLLPNTFSSLTADGLLHFRATNVAISTKSTVRGVLRGVPLAHQLLVDTAKAQLEVSLRVIKQANGNPAFKMTSCSVRAPSANGDAIPKLSPQNERNLMEALMRELGAVFGKLMCPRIANILDTRINQRFSLLSSKISLEETTNFDIVRSILRAEEKLKRLVRQNLQVGDVVRRTLSSRRDIHARLRRQVQRVRQMNWPAGQQRLMLRAPPVWNSFWNRRKRQEKFHLIVNTFNISRATSLRLDFAMLSAPLLTPNGIEIMTNGEIAAVGQSTPFGARPMSLPPPNPQNMLQTVVSDFVPNSLLFHGHKTGMFDTRVDWNTAQLGPMMRTTCDLTTGSLFCVGDLFPTLRDSVPDKRLAFLFTTLSAPAVIVRPEQLGGIGFSLVGLIDIVTEDEQHVGQMQINITANMKMRLTSTAVKGRVAVDDIVLKTRTPQILVQEELDDAGFLSREILQRMVNDILKQGVPIPVHPLFKLVKPKLTLGNRSLVLETNFSLNEHIIRQLTAENLTV